MSEREIKDTIRRILEEEFPVALKGVMFDNVMGKVTADVLAAAANVH